MPAAVVAAVVLLSCGAVLTSDRLAERLIAEDAQATAVAWAEHLGADPAVLAALLEGRPPSAEARAALHHMRGVGQVFRFKFFDRRGELVLVSDDLDGPDAGGSLAAHRGDGAIALRVLGGGTHVESARGAPGSSRPAHYSEAYVPVRRGGGDLVGVAEVYVDQTALRARYKDAFLLAGGATAGLVLLAGFLPAALLARSVKGRRAAEAQRELLVREVDHRAKNVLAAVQSVLRLTRADDKVGYVRAVEARIASLARAHALLADEKWSGAELRAVAERELAPFLGRAQAPPAVLIDGERVPLAPGAVQPVAMALHELATNAAKHGALSRPEGRVALSWALDAATGRLRLLWSESGGPPGAGPPSRRGFGSTVLDATMRRQLGGQATLTWSPEGLRCAIALPVGRVLPAA